MVGWEVLPGRAGPAAAWQVAVCYCAVGQMPPRRQQLAVAAAPMLCFLGCTSLAVALRLLPIPPHLDSALSCLPLQVWEAVESWRNMRTCKEVAADENGEDEERKLDSLRSGDQVGRILDISWAPEVSGWRALHTHRVAGRVSASHTTVVVWQCLCALAQTVA